MSNKLKVIEEIRVTTVKCRAANYNAIVVPQAQRSSRASIAKFPVALSFINVTDC